MLLPLVRTQQLNVKMKAVALLVFLVVVSAMVSETNAGWFRRAVRRIVRGVKKVIRTAKTAYKIYKHYRHGKRGVELTEEEFMDKLATRDIGELVDVNQLSETDLKELVSAQRQTREVMDEMNTALDQEHQELY